MVLLTFRGVVSSAGRFPCGSAVATCQGKAAVLIGEGYANRWSYKVKVTDKDDQQSALTSDVHDLAEGGDRLHLGTFALHARYQSPPKGLPH